MTFDVFASFADAENAGLAEWMQMSHEQRMMLLEQLRRESYPDERITPHRLQRFFSVV